MSFVKSNNQQTEVFCHQFSKNCLRLPEIPNLRNFVCFVVQLFSKYYKEKGEIVMDLGGFTAALEFAVGIEAKVIGKPSPDYFAAALEEMGISPSQAVMVGDDINSDVHAAQKCGMKGVLVKTGKFRESDMNHPVVKPDAIVDNLAHFVDSLL
ncbi:UNVERIFIED_CONTAM: Lhpp [Trichonephila clavipes]